MGIAVATFALPWSPTLGKESVRKPGEAPEIQSSPKSACHRVVWAPECRCPVSPGLLWLLILAQPHGVTRKLAVITSLAQFGVLAPNAVSRQMVQNAELSKFLDVTAEPLHYTVAAVGALLGAAHRGARRGGVDDPQGGNRPSVTSQIGQLDNHPYGRLLMRPFYLFLLYMKPIRLLRSVNGFNHPRIRLQSDEV